MRSFETAGGVVAKGRDPVLPAVARRRSAQRVLSRRCVTAVAEMLIGVGEQCDGLRCDMAMLMTNEVFARTWGSAGGPGARRRLLADADRRASASAHPDLLFMAEAYWDMEWTLQQQGFDLCYDKRLYDRLVHESAASVRGHLQADADYQERLIRFIENHDEPRAAATFEPAKARAAAVVMSTLQGARLYHDGQLDGSPDPHPGVPRPRAGRGRGRRSARRSTSGCCARSPTRTSATATGSCARPPVARQRLATQLVVVVLVNRGVAPPRGGQPLRRRRPGSGATAVGGPGGTDWKLADRLDGRSFDRDGAELASEGLYVDLAPWASHFLSFTS